MKYVLEFGRIGGKHSDNCLITTLKEAKKIASSMVFVFSDSYQDEATISNWWNIGKNTTRICWMNSSHFVALSALDGVARGPASAKLWKGEKV